MLSDRINVECQYPKNTADWCGWVLGSVKARLEVMHGMFNDLPFNSVILVLQIAYSWEIDIEHLNDCPGGGGCPGHLDQQCHVTMEIHMKLSGWIAVGILDG
jgi:hypothetical protein